MDKLPIETLQHIFKLACTDGGFTGCSLSLTSYAVREASRSVRFYSVLLESETYNINAFLKLYQRECSRYGVAPPIITHLFLSNTTKTDYSNIEELIYGNKRFNIRMATERLLALVGGKLESLVLHVTFGCPQLASLSFPALRDLTMMSQTVPHDLHVDPCAFPALERLHLVQPKYKEFTIPPWATHAPRLSHIRLSGIDPGNICFDELLRIRPQGSTSGPAQIYPSLTRLLVQFCPPLNDHQNNYWLMYTWILPDMYALTRHLRDAGIEMSVLRPCRWHYPKWENEVYKEWMHKLNGIEGARDWFSEEDFQLQSSETEDDFIYRMKTESEF